ncbi:MAG: hypothetical protein H6Q68_2813 [Firmicutes bacterium]|nr:hypothetical protein [Bacillota bacterium]
MLLLMTGIISIVALVMIIGWHYCLTLDWQIKLVTGRLNKLIRCQQRDRQVVQQLLKNIYVIINKGMALDNLIVVYQALDLLKLAFGYGVVRPSESARLMAIGVTALNNNKPDTVSFIIDAFRPLVRQLPPESIVSAVDQLTLIATVALKQKHNFLAAKVVECIFFIIEQADVTAEKKILIAAIKALKVIGVLGLRRRDAALFREINKRLSVWIVANPRTDDISTEIASTLTAWLHRITWLDDAFLFSIITDSTFSLIEAEALTDVGIELIIDEWGNVAASACLNPNSRAAGLIIEFIFQVANRQKFNKQWIKVLALTGRVAKLAVYRHGIIAAFMVMYPILELGRKLLWAELRYVEYTDDFHHELLFRVVRECLIILTYAARQNIFGSTGETIVEIFKCWMAHPEIIINEKSVKKYCQLLLLFWLKNKKQAKKYMPRDAEFMEPMLFSNFERQRLGI